MTKNFSHEDRVKLKDVFIATNKYLEKNFSIQLEARSIYILYKGINCENFLLFNGYDKSKLDVEISREQFEKMKSKKNILEKADSMMGQVSPDTTAATKAMIEESLNLIFTNALSIIKEDIEKHTMKPSTELEEQEIFPQNSDLQSVAKSI